MTYTIPPDSPKAAKARAFGAEMVRACRKRDVTLNELARAVGIGHTALDHYRQGAVLPKTTTALEIARVLEWPRLARIIEQARTFVCARFGCGRTYVHDGGGPRKYCTDACVQIVTNQRLASKRLRQAGQTDDGRHRSAAIARLRSAVRITDDRARMAEDAIAAFCAGCEPEGLCRTADCPLRALSPLPLHEARGTGEARRETQLRRERRWAPTHKANHAAAMTARWADPGWRANQVALIGTAHQRMTPEQRAAKGRRISEALRSRPPEVRAAHYRKSGETRRRRNEEATP